MQIFVTKDYQEMSEAAADMIVDLVEEKPGCVLGLATGSTPEGLYAEIAKRHEAEDIDFSRVATFNLDEYRGLPADHEQSYHYFMQKHLFSKINVRPENTHVPNGANPDAQAACDAYEASILLAGGVDLQLLGLGHNGHIGFNEPAPEFPKETHCVDLTESTINANSRLFDSVDWYHHGRQAGARRGERRRQGANRARCLLRPRDPRGSRVHSAVPSQCGGYCGRSGVFAVRRPCR